MVPLFWQVKTRSEMAAWMCQPDFSKNFSFHFNTADIDLQGIFLAGDLAFILNQGMWIWNEKWIPPVSWWVIMRPP
ncbi:MAG: hypothetical protein C4530_09170 [Desulfobacteraceae bacterium]|nr:MAG: hypothetical protein C4530_09170 [Desulfobacteraceae bacterium]